MAARFSEASNEIATDRGNEHSVETLRHEVHRESPQSYLSHAIAPISQMFSSSERSSADSQASEIAYYTGGFLKAAFLFMPSKAGLAGAIVLYALDQACPKDNLQIQLTDLLIGGLKGTFNKGTSALLGEAKVGIATKGVGLGLAMRLADVAFARQTYLNEHNNQLDWQAGFNKIGQEALSKEALLTDAVVFVGADRLLGRMNTLSRGAVHRSPLLSTVLTGLAGTTFGLSSGAYSEIARQQLQGESFSFEKVLKRSLLQAAIDTFVAYPGKIQAARYSQHTSAPSYNSSLIRTGVSSGLLRFLSPQKSTRSVIGLNNNHG